MTEESKNVICSGCGEQVLVEANGQKDDTCACDPVCIVCRRQFKPWTMEGVAGITAIERNVCEDCLDAAMQETCGRLFYWLTDDLSIAPSLQKDERWKHARHSALILFRLDVHEKLVRDNR
jgi:hypothetical protein